MHLLPVDTRSLDQAEVAVDLGQAPGDIVVLSFTDADLALAAASGLDGLRCAPLARLKHPMSVDLYLDTVCRHARAILVRLLGGLDYWRYGAEELARLAREQGIALAVLPGDGREDARLAGLSTVAAADLDRLSRHWQWGGAANVAAGLRHLAGLAGLDRGPATLPAPVPMHGVFGRWSARGEIAGRALVVVYRSVVLADDTAPVQALCDALSARGLVVAALHVASLKDADCKTWIAAQLKAFAPDVILNATAFSALDESGGTVLDRADCPVLQVITAGSSQAAWAASSRGLSAVDLAMHVALPELDGRLLAGAMSFKADVAVNGQVRTVHEPDPAGIQAAADRALAWARLRATPPGERRIAIVMSNYPGGDGRLAHAVGLDTPASALAILAALAGAGYRVDGAAPDGAALMRALAQARPDAPRLTLATYRDWLATIPDAAGQSLLQAWGDPAEDPDCDGEGFALPVLRLGSIALAIQPERGCGLDRKADHHSPDLPPRHAYLAFHLWLRTGLGAHALVHLGTHGTLEWLPGKAAALSPACFPALALGNLPVLYPFIVNNPGEAAQAKRRLGAVTIGHMTPPLVGAGLPPEAAEVERLMDEYAGADGLDPRRMRLLRAEILDAAERSGLAAGCGIRSGTLEEETLARLDAFLCDVKDLQIRDGLHVFGQSAELGVALDVQLEPLVRAAGEAARPALVQALAASGPAEMAGLLAGLDGRFVPPGPAGAPTRGRADVLPTGRNLTALDPRAIPTRAAAAIGARAAEEIVRCYAQDHGEHPRTLVLDLWGSATLRTGGDDLATALALMGVRPAWDLSSHRVSGFEILPPARMERPRVDVTLRISGFFRDGFPQQITLFDEAVRAVAALDEADDWNPLAAARLAGEKRPLRLFGAAPGSYGAGVTERLARGAWQDRADLGRDYLSASGFAYGVGLDGAEALATFSARVAAADAHVHGQDHQEADILDDPTVAAFQGGFAAAAECLGGRASLYQADLSDPAAPRLRTLSEEVARRVFGRAAHPRWIAGMMRHGYRGAAEIANTVDAVFAFAATADVVTDAAFDRLHAAYLEDETVCAFLGAANPEAAAAIRARFAEAVRRGLWHPRRNAVAGMLEAAE